MYEFEKPSDDYNQSGKYYNKYFEISEQLKNEYDAVSTHDVFDELTADLQAYLLNNNVVLDSTIISKINKNGSYYVKLQIGKKPNRVFAYLECSRDLFESINSFSFQNALIAADLTKVSIQETPIGIFINDEIMITHLGKDILLSGECLEAIELAAF
jgi:hypothetical protein